MANVKDSIARDIKTSEQTPTSKVESTQVEPKALKSKVISSEILPGVKVCIIIGIDFSYMYKSNFITILKSYYIPHTIYRGK